MFAVLLAVSAMSPGWQAVFFVAAVFCFVVAAFFVLPGWGAKVNLIALGLALATFVFFWNSLAAS